MRVTMQWCLFPALLLAWMQVLVVLPMMKISVALRFPGLEALQGFSALIMAQMLMGNQQVGRLRVHHPKGLQQIQTPGQDCCRLV